jgi:hypothetical protein
VLLSVEGERWTGEGGKGTGDGKNAGRCPPASCRRPPASFRCRTPRKHRCSTRFRILKGSEGTTLRCAVSNVERMRQAFDFYVESTRWQVVGMQCLAARSAAVTFYIFWGTCSILPPLGVCQRVRCVYSGLLFEGWQMMYAARVDCKRESPVASNGSMPDTERGGRQCGQGYTPLRSWYAETRRASYRSGWHNFKEKAPGWLGRLARGRGRSLKSRQPQQPRAVLSSPRSAFRLVATRVSSVEWG